VVTKQARLVKLRVHTENDGAECAPTCPRYVVNAHKRAVSCRLYGMLTRLDAPAEGAGRVIVTRHARCLADDAGPA
jgi:hypothetical protein